MKHTPHKGVSPTAGGWGVFAFSPTAASNRVAAQKEFEVFWGSFQEGSGEFRACWGDITSLFNMSLSWSMGKWTNVAPPIGVQVV